MPSDGAWPVSASRFTRRSPWRGSLPGSSRPCRDPAPTSMRNHLTPRLRKEYVAAPFVDRCCDGPVTSQAPAASSRSGPLKGVETRANSCFTSGSRWKRCAPSGSGAPQAWRACARGFAARGEEVAQESPPGETRKAAPLIRAGAAYGSPRIRERCAVGASRLSSLSSASRFVALHPVRVSAASAGPSPDTGAVRLGLGAAMLGSPSSGGNEFAYLPLYTPGRFSRKALIASWLSSEVIRMGWLAAAKSRADAKSIWSIR
jgi:hypothetical protein